MAGPANQKCAHHPERAAFALCMTCRKTICQECATQWDGIYHCAPCLAAQRSARVERPRLAGWITLLLSSAILLYISVRVMVWAGALIAGMF